MCRLLYWDGMTSLNKFCRGGGSIVDRGKEGERSLSVEGGDCIGGLRRWEDWVSTLR